MSIEPAPPGKIATAARRFGDDYPPLRGQWQIRRAGAILVPVTLIYIPWMFASLTRGEPWLAWPFLAANALTIFTALLAVFNAWWRTAPKRRPLPHGAEPHVGLVLPTCGAGPGKTPRPRLSGLVQDWPDDKLTVVVSDDAG